MLAGSSSSELLSSQIVLPACAQMYVYVKQFVIWDSMPAVAVRPDAWRSLRGGSIWHHDHVAHNQASLLMVPRSTATGQGLLVQTSGSLTIGDMNDHKHIAILLA